MQRSQVLASTMLAGSLSAGLEVKDGNNDPTPAEPNAADAVKQVMTAFEEFKTTNDSRLAEIEKKGSADVVTAEKLEKIEGTLASFEGMNQKLTNLEGQTKALDELKEQFDQFETAMKRAPSGEQTDAERKASINAFARGVVSAYQLGEANLPEDQKKALEAAREQYKALGIADDTQGGYLAPVEQVREIIKEVTEVSPVRSLVRVRNIGGKAYGQPKRTGRPSARRVHEREERTNTGDLSHGMLEITAPESFALIDISKQNLEDSAYNLEQELREESSEQFAVQEGAEFVNGSGNGECEGILVNANVAKTGSEHATEITSDGLLKLKYALKTAYARNARFLMNRSTMGAVRRLKNGNGDYIWVPGIANGQPNTIDGDPYTEVPDMPNIGAGAFPVAYGDFRRAYTLVDRIAMELLRDPYTQATQGMLRFLFRRRYGGAVVLAEAIRKLEIAA